jgi:hypothetical protein
MPHATRKKQRHWVLLDLSEGARTENGSRLTPEALAHIAEAVNDQLAHEFLEEWGAPTTVRVGTGPDDFRPGEWIFRFLKQLPDDPADSAFHDVKSGQPYALCAVPTCHDLYGPSGLAADVSHEILETAGDEGANLFADDLHGHFRAVELCDAVEMQTYRKTCADGTIVHVSNFLLQSWFIPRATGPYDFMTLAELPGAVAPKAPFHTAAGDGGNYQIICRTEATRRTSADRRPHFIDGTRRKGVQPHWSSRAARRIANVEKLFGTPESQ